MRDHTDGPSSNRNLLPLPGADQTDPAAPQPILEFHRLFVLDGHPYEAIGERWRAEDAAHAASPAVPDLQRPDVALTLYLRDGRTGAIIHPCSDAQYARAVRRHRRQAASDRPGDSSRSR